MLIRNIRNKLGYNEEYKKTYCSMVKAILIKNEFVIPRNERDTIKGIDYEYSALCLKMLVCCIINMYISLYFVTVYIVATYVLKMNVLFMKNEMNGNYIDLEIDDALHNEIDGLKNEYVMKCKNSKKLKSIKKVINRYHCAHKYVLHIKKTKFYKNSRMKNRKIQRHLVDIKYKIHKVDRLPLSSNTRLLRNDNRLLLPIFINNKSINFEIDTGSSISLVSEKNLLKVFPSYKYQCKIRKINRTFIGVSGTELNFKHVAYLSINVPSFGTFKHRFYVSNDDCPSLLGREFLSFTNAQILSQNNLYFISFDTKIETSFSISPDEDIIVAPNTYFYLKLNLSKYHINDSNPLYIVSIDKNKLKLNFPLHLVDLRSSSIVSLQIFNSTHKYLIQKESISFKFSNINNDQLIDDSSKVPIHYIQRENILNENIPTLDRILYCNNNDSLENFYYELGQSETFSHDLVCNKCIKHYSSHIGSLSNVDIISLHESHSKPRPTQNISYDVNALQPAIIVNCEAYKPDSNSINIISDNDFNKIDDIESFIIGDKSYDGNENYLDKISIGVEPLYSNIHVKETVDKFLENYPEEISNYIKPQLLKNQNLHSSSSWRVPPLKDPDDVLDFELTNEIPKNTRIYSCKPEHRASLFSTLQYMIHFNLISRCGPNESFGCSAFTLYKPSSDSVRLLLDLRENNKLIRSSPTCAMESVHSIVQGLARFKWASQVDLSNCYYSIPLSKAVLKSGYSNFLTCFGAFKLLRCPQGASGAPQTLQKILFKHLYHDESGKLDNQNVFQFYDDVSVLDDRHTSLFEHLDKFLLVLERLTNAGFIINLFKSRIAVNLEKESLRVLGFEVMYNTILMPREKASKIVDILVKPKKLVDLQKLLGILNFHRNQLPTKILHHISFLSNAIQKNTLEWSLECDKKLQEIRNYFIESPNHAIEIPTENSILFLFSDASSHSAGASLFFINLSDISFNTILPEVNCQDRYVKLQGDLKKHCNVFKLPIIGLHKECFTLLDIYRDIMIEFKYLDVNCTQEYVLDHIASNIMILIPKFEHILQEGTEKITRIIDNVLNNNFSSMYVEYLIFELVSILTNRRIIIINTLYNPKYPFIKIGKQGYRNPIVIGVFDKGYQLVGFSENYLEYDKHNTFTSESLSSEQKFKIFKHFAKKDSKKIRYAGGYVKKFNPSFMHVAVHLKELASLLFSLRFFSEFCRIHTCLILTDSAAVNMGLKSKTSPDYRRFIKYSLLIQSEFPLCQIIYINTLQNKADQFSRIFNFKENIDIGDYEITNLSNYVKFELTPTIDNKINIVHPNHGLVYKPKNPIQTLSPGMFVTLLSFDLIAKEQAKIIDKLDMSLYKQQGLLIMDSMDRILIPKSLEIAIIFKQHIFLNHVGVLSTFKVLINEYCFLSSNTSIKNLTHELINSCSICLRIKPNTKNIKVGSHYFNDYLPCQLAHMDIFEHSKITKKRNTNFHLIIADSKSHYVELFYLEQQTEFAVVAALKNIISRNPFLRAISTDNGSIFRGNLIKSFCKMHDIKLLLSGALRSYSRGYIENYIKFFRTFSKLAKITHPKVNPLEFLPLACEALNNKIIANNLSAKEIYFSYLLNNNMTTDASSQELYDNAKQAVNDMASFYEQKADKINKNRSTHSYKINDIVILRNFNKLNKSIPFYSLEPFRIINLSSFLATLESLWTNVVVVRNILDIKRLVYLPEITFPKDLDLPMITEKYMDNLRQQKEEKNTGPLTRSKRKKLDNQTLDESDEEEDGNDVEFEELS